MCFTIHITSYCCMLKINVFRRQKDHPFIIHQSSPNSLPKLPSQTPVNIPNLKLSGGGGGTFLLLLLLSSSSTFLLLLFLDLLLLLVLDLGGGGSGWCRGAVLNRARAQRIWVTTKVPLVVRLEGRGGVEVGGTGIRAVSSHGGGGGEGCCGGGRWCGGGESLVF